MISTVKNLEKCALFANYKTVLSTKASGLKVKTSETAEAYKSGPTAQDMMDFGKTAWPMAEADSFMPMVTFMRANGSKTKLTDMEYNKIITEVGTKANGKTTNNTVTAWKSGQTEVLTKVSTKKG